MLSNIPVVFGTGEFRLLSRKNHLEQPPKLDFPLENWEQLRLPAVKTCRTDSAFVDAPHVTKLRWKHLYFTRHRVRLKSVLHVAPSNTNQANQKWLLSDSRA